jgi:hypothetical protein
MSLHHVLRHRIAIDVHGRADASASAAPRLETPVLPEVNSKYAVASPLIIGSQGSATLDKSRVELTGEAKMSPPLIPQPGSAVMISLVKYEAASTDEFD